MRDIELPPAGVTSGGEAIARHPSGRMMFVPGALPGETVRVAGRPPRRDRADFRIMSRRKSARGRVAGILEPSPHFVPRPAGGGPATG